MISFTAYGKPEPQGSARAFVVRGRAIVTSDNPALKEWRTQLGRAAQACPDYTGVLIPGPVRIEATFLLQKSKSRPRRDTHPTSNPDLDKLARALLDAITGVLIANDNQVCDLDVRKRWAEAGDAPHVTVTVAELV